MLGELHSNVLSMERIVPDQLASGEATGTETLELHLERYRFAQQYLIPGNVLDIACGVGYGTGLLATDPKVVQVLGVDISPDAVAYARERYAASRVSFMCADALIFSPDRQFENIVCLETIEHVDDPHALLNILIAWLAPEGRLIASAPVTPSVDVNLHHKTNFSSKMFLKMGERLGLKYVDALNQTQAFSLFAIATRRESRTIDLRPKLARFYLRHPLHFALRLWSTMYNGFVNKYITVVWQK